MLLASGLKSYIHIETRPVPEKGIWGWAESIFFIYKNRNNIAHVIIDLYGYKWFYFACLAGFICRLLKIKYIIIPHSYVLKLKWDKGNKLLFSLLCGSEIVVSPSSFFSRLFQDRKINTAIIPNPVADHLFPRIPFKSIQSPKLVWVRNVNSKYCPDVAIKVLHILHSKYPEAKLTLVGEYKNNYKQELNAMAASLGVENNLNFTGRMANNTWAVLATQHNIFINTSPIDNAPLSLIEAALTGLPIVSTCAGGIPVMFEENKEILLCPINQPEAMVKCIERLIEQPDFAKKLTDEAFKKAGQNRLTHVTKLWADLLFHNKLPVTA